MEFQMKALLFEQLLKQNESGYSREDREDGALFLMSAENGSSFAVSFPKEGMVGISSVVRSYPGLSDERRVMLMGFLNYLNREAVLAKAYVNPEGLVALGAWVYEVGGFNPFVVFETLAAVNKQTANLSSALETFEEAMQAEDAEKKEGEAHA